jgi:hypothetical protein
MSRIVIACVSALMAIVLATATVTAHHDAYRRISTGQINGNSNIFANYQGASADGSRVFFMTTEQLVTGDTDSENDVYQRYAGKTTLISDGQINGDGAFGAFFTGVSANGARVFFETSEKLVSTDTDDETDDYQRFNGVTTRVSVGKINGNGPFGTTFAGSSADGTVVFFHTDEVLAAADTDGQRDIYQRANGKTKLVSGGGPDASADFNFASTNGSVVVFSSYESILANDTDEYGDIYMRTNGVTTRVSKGTINGNQDFDSTFVGASADGTRIFFETDEALVPGDTDESEDVYQWSNGVTKRLSLGPDGGNGDFFADYYGQSVDGTKVFFSTAEKLLAADTDNSADVYMRQGTTTTLISRGQINGNTEEDAYFVGCSADGTHVFFRTAEKLVNADTDASEDIYERLGGTTTQISAGEINGNDETAPQFDRASADGSIVFFETSEALVADDGDALTDIYEREGGVTYAISIGDGNSNVNFHGSSTNGSAVFFSTYEAILINDKDLDLDIYGAYNTP